MAEVENKPFMERRDIKISHESDDLETLLDKVIIDIGLSKYLYNPQFTTSKSVWAPFLAKGFNKEIEIDADREVKESVS